jgi:hypothetical protein
MSTVTVDFIARGTSEGTWSIVLVEEGPWPASDIEANLRRLQERLYNCIDAAIDGQLAKRFPESNGGLVTVRLDGYDLPQLEVREFFERFTSSILRVPDYAFALGQSSFVSGLKFELNLDHLKH